MKQMQYIMMDGEVIPFNEAKLHVLSPAVTYAATVFEGIRMYWNEADQQLRIFRLNDHLKRLNHSIRMMRYDIEIDVEELIQQTITIIRKNDIRGDSYSRIMAMVTSEDHPNIGTSGPVSIAIAPGWHAGSSAWREKGMRTSVSSWARINDRTHPPRIKATSNYTNGRLAMLDAKRSGYDATIMLTTDGKVAEAPIASIFMVREGKVITPAVTDGILESITRATIIELCQETLDLEVIERSVDRTELYTADELFFCASALEIAPIASVDDIPVVGGAPGHVTRRIRDAYETCVQGNFPREEWFTAVY